MITFSWDARKAQRNDRLHGIPFPLARAALESGLGVAIEEQFRDDEWRTSIIAPLRGMYLIQIAIAFYTGGPDDPTDTTGTESFEGLWLGSQGEIRIISARAATPHEQRFYFQNRPAALGDTSDPA